MPPKRFEKGIQCQFHPGQGRWNGQSGLKLLNGQVRSPDEGIDQDQIPEMVRAGIRVIMYGQTGNRRSPLRGRLDALPQKGVGNPKFRVGSGDDSSLNRPRSGSRRIQNLLAIHAQRVGVGIPEVLLAEQVVKEGLTLVGRTQSANPRQRPTPQRAGSHTLPINGTWGRSESPALSPHGPPQVTPVVGQLRLEEGSGHIKGCLGEAIKVLAGRYRISRRG